MGYLKKFKYSLSDAARIISQKTETPHNKQDIFDIAFYGEIRIILYKSNMVYFEKNKPSSNGEFLIDNSILHESSRETIYPVLDYGSIGKFKDGYKEATFYLYNSEAIDSNGTIVKISDYNKPYILPPKKNLLYLFKRPLKFFFNRDSGVSKFYEISIYEKELFILKLDLEKYIYTFLNPSSPIYSTKKMRDISARRLLVLIKWIKQQNSSFNPHQHGMKKSEVWEELQNIDTEKIFTASALTKDNELASTPKSFFLYVSKEDPTLINFKSGRRTK